EGVGRTRKRRLARRGDLVGTRIRTVIPGSRAQIARPRDLEYVVVPSSLGHRTAPLLRYRIGGAAHQRLCNGPLARASRPASAAPPSRAAAVRLPRPFPACAADRPGTARRSQRSSSLSHEPEELAMTHEKEPPGAAPGGGPRR